MIFDSSGLSSKPAFIAAIATMRSSCSLRCIEEMALEVSVVAQSERKGNLRELIWIDVAYLAYALDQDLCSVMHEQTSAGESLEIKKMVPFPYLHNFCWKVQ